MKTACSWSPSSPRIRTASQISKPEQRSTTQQTKRDRRSRESGNHGRMTSGAPIHARGRLSTPASAAVTKGASIRPDHPRNSGVRLPSPLARIGDHGLQGFQLERAGDDLAADDEAGGAVDVQRTGECEI